MTTPKKDSSNRLGMFFSIALHVAIIGLILYWGFSGSSQYSSNPGPIQVSLSGLETGGTGGAKKPAPKKEAPKPKPPEPEVVEKQEEPPPPPEKIEPEKKEVVKEEPKKEEKKDAIPLKTEKKEEKKEVAEKPKPTAKPTPKATEKPKATPKATAKPKPTTKPKPKATKKPAKKKDLDKEKEKILKDIQRQKVLDELKKDKPAEEVLDDEIEENIEEEIGQERRLAMADDEKIGGDPDEFESEIEGSGGNPRSGGSSAISPLIIQTYSNQVHRKISRNWRIPPGVPTDGGISTSVVFKVDGSGNVNNVRVIKSSGNSVFDNYCKQAIIRSAPLPPPPPELAVEAKNSGIELTFRPDQ